MRLSDQRVLRFGGGNIETGGGAEQIHNSVN